VSDSPDDVRPHSDEYLDSTSDSASDGRAAGAGTGGDEDAHVAARPATRRRGLVAGAVLAVGLIGGGVAYGVAQLSGGGAQPEQMVPASALAVITVDLDPSAGQKVDALRFARKFPELKARAGGGDDLRKVLFEVVSDSSQVGASWQDVEPWLGERAALAVLPAADELDDPRPVVVLAVTDETKARAGLPAAMPEVACEVSDGFAVCGQDAATAKATVAAASQKSLADDATYTRDVEAVGGRGVLGAWVDLARVKQSASDALSGMGGLAGSLAGATTSDLSGRYVAALRFDGPHLELAGRVDGVDLPRVRGSADAGSLPPDTLVALGMADAGTVVQSAWDRLREVASAMGGAESFDDQVSTLASTYGVKLPDDLVSAVGERLAVAVGPGTTSKVAVRVDGSRTSIATLLRAAEQASGTSVPLATVPSGDDTVISTDESYAQVVAQAASGGDLGGTDRFADAVADPDGAVGVLFVDIAGLVSSHAEQLGVDARTLERIKPLSALGVSVRQDGEALDFRLRLVTR
jgi:hypothetical protein